MDDSYEVLDVAVKEARAWLHDLPSAHVGATASLTDLRKKFAHSLPARGTSPEKVLAHLVDATAGGLLANTGGRFFGWVMGGTLPSALAADWLVSAWDQNPAIYECSPAMSVCEETCGKWLLELFELPSDCSFAFTTGCQMAHFTCLAAARHKVLADVGWDVSRAGLCNAPPIKVLANTHRHASVDRTVRFLGLGTDAIVPIQTTGDARIIVNSFRETIAKFPTPKIVELNAADLNIAAFDMFSTLIPIAREHGAWVHIDGAFGLFTRASESKKYLLRGAELADSWAVDTHKWLNTPFDCGFAAVRDREAHRAAMSVRAEYIEPTSAARDQINWNPEWSRRARALPVYAALMELGKKGVAALVDRTCDACKRIVTEVGALPNSEIFLYAGLNQGLLRFHDPRPDASEENHNQRTRQVIDAINDSGVALFSPSTWEGKTVMRVSVVGWNTTDADIDKVVAAFRKILRKNKN